MVDSFSEIQDEFFGYMGDIVYATMTTVDAKGRPRSRILIAVWEVIDGRPVGWLATFKTPVKTAHLANNPHATFSYWDRRQNATFADTVAAWVEDPEVKQRVWDLYRRGSPPRVGYDPGRYWRGSDDPRFAVLRLDPWRVQVVRGADLRSRIWRAEVQPTRSRQPDKETQKGDVMTDRKGKEDQAGSVRYVNPDGLSKNPAFTNVVVVEGRAKTVYVGGQDSVDASGNIVGKGDIAAQTEQVLANLRAALDAGGAKPEHVVKWNLFVVEGVSLQAGFAAFQRAWVDTPNPPAIIVAFVAGLAHPDFLVEMDAIAVVPQ